METSLKRAQEYFAAAKNHHYFDALPAFVFALGGTPLFSPLAPAALAAYFAAHKNPFPALFGAVLGSFLCEHYFAMTSCLFFCGTALLMELFTTRHKPMDKLVTLVTAQLLMLPFFAFSNAKDALIASVSIIISAIIFVVLYELLSVSNKTLPTTGKITAKKLVSVSEILADVSGVISRKNSEAEFASRQLLAASRLLYRLSEPSVKTRRTRFHVIAAAAACPKAHVAVPGDSFLLKRSGEELILAISDGMGTGEAARRQSSAAVSFFSELISAGFLPCEASECVNRFLLARGNDEVYATLDVIIINLVTGVARFVKHGAPPAFLLRNNKLHTVYKEALPLGIITEVKGGEQETKLIRGDTLIILSDGISDALGANLYAVLTDCCGNKPSIQTDQSPNLARTFADAILNKALASSAPNDDMTVLIAIVE